MMKHIQPLAVAKRAALLALALSILFTSGCLSLFFRRSSKDKEGPAQYRYSTEYDTDQAIVEAILLALQEKDTTSLKSLFSEKSLAEIEDLDAKLEAFSQYIDEEIDSWEYNGGGSRESADYGFVVHNMGNHYDINTAEGKYLVGYRYIIRDDGDRSVEGITAITITTEEIRKEQHEIEGPVCDLSVPGIYIFYEAGEPAEDF